MVTIKLTIHCGYPGEVRVARMESEECLRPTLCWVSYRLVAFNKSSQSGNAYNTDLRPIFLPIFILWKSGKKAFSY